MNYLKMMLFSLIVTLSFFAKAEVPPKPSLMEVCIDSAIVIKAKLLKENISECTINIEYSIATFEIEKVFKGKQLLSEYNLSTDSKTKVINVLFLKENGCSGYLVPKYNNGQSYFLFLDQEIIPSLYIRSRYDILWEETEWTAKTENEILKILFDSSKSNLSNCDYSIYQIPESAKQKEIDLSVDELKRGVVRKIEYWLDSKKVGEKAWQKNELSEILPLYEEPMKDGLLYGKAKYWYSNGKLSQERYYFYSRMHGPYIKYDREGNISETTYWIKDINIDERDYRRRMNIDEVLPRI